MLRPSRQSTQPIAAFAPPLARPSSPIPRIPGSRGLAAAGLVLASGCVSTQGLGLREPRWSADASLQASLHFGGPERPHFGLALEGRGVHGQVSFECGAGTARFEGVVGRLQLVGWDQVRLIVGPQVGRRDGTFAAGVELGLGYRLGRDPGPLGQFGVEAGALSLVTSRLAYAFARDVSIAAGLRSPTAVELGCWVEGRPLRRGRERAPLAGARVLPTSQIALAPDLERTAAATHWLGRARAEWASVPAFCELHEQLVASGAPAALASRALEAAEDEVRHALAVGMVAATLFGAPIELCPPVRGRREVARGRDGLARLAAESWVDGCLGEGLAAALAAEEAVRAESPLLRETQRMVAADEARHAELAWDVLAWTLGAAGHGRCATLAVDTEIRRPLAISELDGADRFGILSRPSRERVALEQGARARARMAAVGAQST